MADTDKVAEKIEQHVPDVDHEELEDRLRLIAYGVWEEEGRPHGRAHEHWQEAERRAKHAERAGDYVTPSAESGVSKNASEGRLTKGADSTSRPQSGEARRTTKPAAAKSAAKRTTKAKNGEGDISRS